MHNPDTEPVPFDAVETRDTGLTTPGSSLHAGGIAVSLDEDDDLEPTIVRGRE